MSTTSASRAEAGAPAPTASRVLIWDAPVRVFHWLMVLCFAGAYLSAESERWRLLHVTLGYTMAGLVGFRVVWGLIGSRYARFANFVRGPGAVLAYLRALRQGHPAHYIGHNPAGSVAIVALLALTGAVAVTGWFDFNEIGPRALGEAHEFVANLMLILVAAHVVGVLLGNWQHHEKLIGAMISGRKPGRAQDGIGGAARWVAAALMAAVLAFWFYQWRSDPAAVAGAGAAQTIAPGRHADRDGD